MKKTKNLILIVLLAVIALLVLRAVLSSSPPSGTDPVPQNDPQETVVPSNDTPAEPGETGDDLMDPDGSYSSKEDVALYIHQYGRLPQNFITKDKARSLGWDGGSLEPYAKGASIGGDRFGNYEGILPDKPGRTYTECDIDTAGKKSRGAKRIVFSNDGLIYYTSDHYESFELLYGEEDAG